MRRKPAIILSACVLASIATSASAADQQSSTTQAPLAPGGAAGIHKAEMTAPSTAVWVAGGAIVVAGIALAVSGNGNGHGPSTTSTTGTH
ncbi:MAG TPA: hypothetical protein VIM56_16120 [Rhizomicrobium sp.]